MEEENVSDSKFVNSIPYILGGIFFGIILLLAFQNFINREESIEAYEVIVKKLSNNGYKKTEQIEVIANTPSKVEYSFDGGYTWQKDNIYTATSNGDLTIFVKDENGEIVKKRYSISGIDNKGPVINYVYNQKIYVGDNINTSSLFKVTDDVSGVSNIVSYSPNKIDTKKAGIKNVVINAADNVGNLTTITFEIEVKNKSTKNTSKTTEKTNTKDENKTSPKTEEVIIEPEDEVKTKYYRYRTKTYIEYDCDSYSCNDEEVVDAKTEIVSTDKCPSNYKTSKETTSNTCLVPVPKGVSCGEAITPVYKKNSDGLYYSRIAIKTETKSKEYKQSPCGEDEYESNGFCYANCEKLDPKTKEIVSTGKCVENYKTCHQSIKAGTCPAGQSCIALYSSGRFGIHGDNTIYDSYPLYKDGSSAICDGKTLNSPTLYKTSYKQSPCDKNEFEENGYCYAMCEKKKVSCEKGYTLDGDKCKKTIEKTCYGVCYNSSWGPWSDWSTQKVVANENTQVEEKYE